MNIIAKFCHWYLNKYPPRIENVDLINGFFIVRFDPDDENLGDIGEFVTNLQRALDDTDKNIGAVFIPNTWEWDMFSENEFLQIWRTRTNDTSVQEHLSKEAFSLYERSLAERHALREENVQLKKLIGPKMRGEVVDEDMLITSDEDE